MNIERIRKVSIITFIAIGLSFIVLGKYFTTPLKEYSGVGDGFEDEIKVTLTMKKLPNGKNQIVKVECTHNDTKEVAGPAIEKMIEQLKHIQNIEKVDTVAGASYSSSGFIDAVKDALAKVEK